ncbi:MAG TPA: hypothetical protein VGP33_05030 [Chloroflexota bacterium]|jgi:hypothetical protein|nr:hypothetical protein [Chloroflexota bacterium]
MSLNFYSIDPDGEAARAAYQARLHEAALERLAREGMPTLREQAARSLVALAVRLAPTLHVTVAVGSRQVLNFGN